MKERKISRDELERALTKKITLDNSSIYWDAQITEGVYKKIYEYPTTSDSTLPYCTSMDIVRYMKACLSHVNDNIYDTVRGKVCYIF